MNIKAAVFLAACVAACSATNVYAPNAATRISASQPGSADAALLHMAGDVTARTAFEDGPVARRRSAAQAAVVVLRLAALVNDRESAHVLRLLAAALRSYQLPQVEEASRLRLVAERRLSR